MILAGQSRKRHPSHPPRNRRLHFPCPRDLSISILHHIRLVDPAHEHRAAGHVANLLGIKGERDGPTTTSDFLPPLGLESRQGLEIRHIPPAIRHEPRREIERPPRGNPRVERRGLRERQAQPRGGAEEGVLAGFVAEDGRRPCHESGVGDGEAGDEVDYTAYARHGDDVREADEVVDGVDVGEGVGAGFEGPVVEVREDALCRGDVDLFLGVDLGDDGDEGVILLLVVPIVEPADGLREEAGFEVLEEVDGLEVGDGCGGDVGGEFAVRGAAAGEGGEVERVLVVGGGGGGTGGEREGGCG